MDIYGQAEYISSYDTEGDSPDLSIPDKPDRAEKSHHPYTSEKAIPEDPLLQ